MTRKQIKNWLDQGGDLKSALGIYDELPARIQGRKARIPIIAALRVIARDWGEKPKTRKGKT